VLRRLYNAGSLNSYVVPSEQGPNRKYYGLNDTGRQRLAEAGKTWRSFAETMDTLLGGAA
jgi:PadR family transcriptional regulator PadR